jgi:hypothetical protein
MIKWKTCVKPLKQVLEKPEEDTRSKRGSLNNWRKWEKQRKEVQQATELMLEKQLKDVREATGKG